MTKEKAREVAHQMMEEIQYDNGCVDKWHPEKYPEEWMNRIAECCIPVFDNHPDYLNQEWIEEFCCGERDEVRSQIGDDSDLKALDAVLNDYFDSI